jgi:hypothetical protein
VVYRKVCIAGYLPFYRKPGTVSSITDFHAREIGD